MLCLPTLSQLYISPDKMGTAGKAFSVVTQFCCQAGEVRTIFAFWSFSSNLCMQRQGREDAPVPGDAATFGLGHLGSL